MSNSGRKLSALLIGAGRFGALHARVWTENGVEIVGVCDLSNQRRDLIACRCPQAVLGDNADAMLRQLRPDVTIVATDEQSHGRLVLNALNAGAHVFVEKPLATTVQEARAIRAVATEAGREVVAGHISRFSAPHVRIREAIRSGRLGNLCALRLRRDFSREWFAAFGDRVDPVWESCVHDVDLAIAFAEQAPRAVGAVAGPAGSGVVSAHLCFDDGLIATIESAWLVPPSAPRTLCGALELSGVIAAEVDVLGAAGTIHHRSPTHELVDWSGEFPTIPDCSLWPEVDGRITGALRSEVEYAIAVFQGQRPADLMPLDEACCVVATTAAIERSLITQTPIEIEVS